MECLAFRIKLPAGTAGNQTHSFHCNRQGTGNILNPESGAGAQFAEKVTEFTVVAQNHKKYSVG